MNPKASPAIRSAIMIFALLGATSLAPRGAAAQTNAPTTVGASGQVRQDRINLLREELKERKEELKEARERAARAKKGKATKGMKVIPAPGDDDRLPANLRAGHVSLPFGITQATIAPTNTKANDKTADGAGAGQAEQHLAFLGLNGLCAWNDGQGFTTPPDVQGYGYTINGGATWTDGGVPLKQGTITAWTSDPAVTVNEKTGDFYYCGLTSNSGVNNNGVGVARGHFQAGTFVWDAATMAVAGPSATQFFDKQWIAADSSNGNLYVSWTLFGPGTTNIFFARSTDNGATWSLPLLVSKPWEIGLVSGSRPMVGPNGEVYVQYTAIGTVDADSVKITKSTNGGLTFGPSVVGMIKYDNYFTGAPGFNRPRAVSFAGGAVDRSFGANRGRVYLTIQDCLNFYDDPIGGGTSKSEVEVNSGFANATPFTIFQVLRGNIANGTDQDWFSFPATQGTTYIFYVDSLRSTGFRYTLRLYCPNDTTALSRLAFSGAQATNSAQNSHSLIVWTAPTTNTYYLRMVPVTVNVTSNPYRIQSGIAFTGGGDVARDTRDVVATSSADGVTGWAARQIVNDDVPLYDNWLPEIAVPCDGYVYDYWMDFRDTPASCFGGSNIYLSRSTNGGTSWSANQVVTTATTPNWTQVLSNIAPNQGDYNGIYGGDVLAMAFADGRLGDADVFTARLNTNFTVSACPPSGNVTAGTTYNQSVTVSNLNSMFGNTYTYTITVNRNWPGLPGGGSTTVAAGAGGSIPISFAVPDSAEHLEVVHVCLTVNCEGGGCPQTCCWDLTVINPVTPALASLASVTASPNSVRLSWLMSGASSADIERSGDGSSWTVIGQGLTDGQGFLNYTDNAVTAGSRYAYRVSFLSDGRRISAAQTWVLVPVGAGFALQGARPNPATRGFAVTFSLPSNEKATLDVIDLAGRRVLSREVGHFGAGTHTLGLERETSSLAPGVYNMRLTQGSRVVHTHVSIVR